MSKAMLMLAASVPATTCIIGSILLAVNDKAFWWAFLIVATFFAPSINWKVGGKDAE